MREIMTLRQAIEEKKISIGTEAIKYNHETYQIKLSGKKTGCKEEQVFRTNILSWKLVELKRGQLALLAVTSTDQFLTLHGERGAKNTPKIINSVCSIWSSEELGLEAKSISKKDLEELQKSVKPALKGIWIGAKENVLIKGKAPVLKDIIYYIDNNAHLNKYTLVSSEKGESTFTAEIRPIVYLPDKILIDISTKRLYKDYNAVSKERLKNVINKIEVTDDIMKELNEILENM